MWPGLHLPWVRLVLDKLEDEEDDPAIQMLVCMIIFDNCGSSWGCY